MAKSKGDSSLGNDDLILFAEAYNRTGNAAEAYQTIRPAVSRGSASKMGRSLLRRPAVCSELERLRRASASMKSALASGDLSAVDRAVAVSLAEVAVNPHADPADRYRAAQAYAAMRRGQTAAPAADPTPASPPQGGGILDSL